MFTTTKVPPDVRSVTAVTNDVVSLVAHHCDDPAAAGAQDIFTPR